MDGQTIFSGSDDATIFSLTIPLEGGAANPIVIQAPGINGSDVRPAIGVSRDRTGRLHFHIGANDFVPRNLPQGIREWYEGLNQSVRRGGRVYMPSCSRIRSMTYESYEMARRVFYTGSNALNGEIWLYLPRDVFQAVINQCRSRR